MSCVHCVKYKPKKVVRKESPRWDHIKKLLLILLVIYGAHCISHGLAITDCLPLSSQKFNLQNKRKTRTALTSFKTLRKDCSPEHSIKKIEKMTTKRNYVKITQKLQQQFQIYEE